MLSSAVPEIIAIIHFTLSAASLTDGSVVSRLRADVGETQQMDEHLIGSFALRADGSSQDDLSTAETSSIMSGSEEALPSRLQVGEGQDCLIMGMRCISISVFYYQLSRKNKASLPVLFCNHLSLTCQYISESPLTFL